jgi:hypothetical protein
MVFVAIADWAGCSPDEFEQAVEAAMREAPPSPEA